MKSLVSGTRIPPPEPIFGAESCRRSLLDPRLLKLQLLASPSRISRWARPPTSIFRFHACCAAAALPRRGAVVKFAARLWTARQHSFAATSGLRIRTRRSKRFRVFAKNAASRRHLRPVCRIDLVTRFLLFLARLRARRPFSRADNAAGQKLVVLGHTACSAVGTTARWPGSAPYNCDATRSRRSATGSPATCAQIAAVALPGRRPDRHEGSADEPCGAVLQDCAAESASR